MEAERSTTVAHAVEGVRLALKAASSKGVVAVRPAVLRG